MSRQESLLRKMGTADRNEDINVDPGGPDYYTDMKQEDSVKMTSNLAKLLMSSLLLMQILIILQVLVMVLVVVLGMGQ